MYNLTSTLKGPWVPFAYVALLGVGWEAAAGPRQPNILLMEVLREGEYNTNMASLTAREAHAQAAPPDARGSPA